MAIEAVQSLGFLVSKCYVL